MSKSVHKTVLLNETIEGLNLKPNSVVIDATFGGGGHSLEICKRFPNTKIIALDQDKNVAKNIPAGCDITFHNINFRNLDKLGVKADAVIFDLGLSSDQIDNSGRGFTFQKDESLLMTMKKSIKPSDLTAREIVNTWEEKNLADIIYGYGEEKFARRIARGIVEARGKREIKTTFDLVRIIGESVPAIYRRRKIHPATKTFQALRIAVNDELGALKEGLEKGFDVLEKGGRMSVISFHSLEDRIVKKFYKQKVAEGLAIFPPKADQPRAETYKKPITPTKEEIIINNRSRSAKLRVLSKVK